jgi:hypothetical protein
MGIMVFTVLRMLLGSVNLEDVLYIIAEVMNCV